MKDAKLKRFAHEFREGILDGRKSTNFCFMVCWPLFGLLQALGVSCRLNQPEEGKPGHVWIDLPDGRILDPTADQFRGPNGEKMPQVYLGPKPDWYETQLR